MLPIVRIYLILLYIFFTVLSRGILCKRQTAGSDRGDSFSVFVFTAVLLTAEKTGVSRETGSGLGLSYDF